MGRYSDGGSTEVLVAEPETYNEKCISALSKVGKVTAKKMGRKELLSNIEKFDVLVIRLETWVDRELIDRAKKLKIIGVAATGLDHVDVDYAAEKGIKVASLKGERKFLEGVNATVEHTFALILSLIRNVPWAFDEVKRERWTRTPFFGWELNGKTMGILGLGRIGSKVAKIAKGFGMEVIACDPYVGKAAMRKSGVEKVDIDSLLARSNAIVVCAALNRETVSLIGTKEFEQMRLKPILINASRGKIVSEEALFHALEKGLVSGAAVDVLSREAESDNPLKNSPLVKYAKGHDNLIITPHLGGATFESMERTGIFIAEKVGSLAKKLG